MERGLLALDARFHPFPGEVTGAEVLQLRVDDPGGEDGLTRLDERALHAGNARPDFLRRRSEPRHLEIRPLGGQPRVRIREDLAVAEAERLDPALLSEGERHEVPELDDLLVAEVLPELLPDAVVGPLRVPHEHARIEERGLLPVIEAIGMLELEKLVVVLLDQSLLSAPERPLRPSVVASDRLRDVDPAELLDPVITDAVPEDPLPVPREGAEHCGDASAGRLALGPRRAEPSGMIEVAAELRIVELLVGEVADARHGKRIAHTHSPPIAHRGGAEGGWFRQFVRPGGGICLKNMSSRSTRCNPSPKNLTLATTGGTKLSTPSSRSLPATG